MFTNNSIDLTRDTRDKSLSDVDELTFVDSDWVKNNYMVSGDEINVKYRDNRFRSVTDNMFTDTSLGGNLAINTYSQFTRYADPRSKGIMSNRDNVNPGKFSVNAGLGLYYGEAIEDNSTNVFFEFGVPEFNNVLYYLMSSIDYKKAVIANSGRSTFFYNAGELFGLGALVIAFGVVSIGVILAKKAFQMATDIFSNSGRFDHYYLKPIMYRYWQSVNSIVTMMGTELGLTLPVFDKSKSDKSKVGITLKVEDEEIDAMSELLPGLIDSSNCINVQALVCRTQMNYNKYMVKRLKAQEDISKLAYREDRDYSIETIKVDNDKPGNLWKNIKPHVENDVADGFDPEGEDDSSFTDALNGKTSEEIDAMLKAKDGKQDRALRGADSEGYISKALNVAKAVFDEGARYAVFRTDPPSSISESFSNSTTTVSLGDTINSTGDKWRDIKFNLGGGEIPIVSDIVAAITDFAVGALDGLTLGATNTIGGFLSGAKIETPKRWEDSTASLPSLTFKTTLIAPSAHPLAQLKSIYIPIASLLAGTLPQETGNKSYTTPYHCNMFARGQHRIANGMITNLTITRGVSNLPFNKQRRPLAVEVSWTVTDFSEVLSAPISDSVLSTASVIYDDESGISRYIQSLCGRDLYATMHASDKYKIKLSRFYQNAKLQATPEYIGARIGDSLTSIPLFSLTSGKTAVNYSELY